MHHLDERHDKPRPRNWESVVSMTSIHALAEDLGLDPGDIRVILRQHDVNSDELSDRTAADVRHTLDPGGERSGHYLPRGPYSQGHRRSPTDPEPSEEPDTTP